MSRIGKKPIPVPGGTKVSINPSTRQVDVEGPKGKLSLVHRPEVAVAWEEDEKRIVCSIEESRFKHKPTRAYWGLTRSLIANMVEGVNKGYQKKLEVVGVGWSAQVQGRSLTLNVGYASPVKMNIPLGVEAGVQGQILTLTGIDKQAVGDFASSIRAKRKPEPYNGKGVKYFEEVIARKQGKAFGA